jgi:hypothetical protein
MTVAVRPTRVTMLRAGVRCLQSALAGFLGFVATRPTEDDCVSNAVADDALASHAGADCLVCRESRKSQGRPSPPRCPSSRCPVSCRGVSQIPAAAKLARRRAWDVYSCGFSRFMSTHPGKRIGVARRSALPNNATHCVSSRDVQQYRHLTSQNNIVPGQWISPMRDADHWASTPHQAEP